MAFHPALRVKNRVDAVVLPTKGVVSASAKKQY